MYTRAVHWRPNPFCLPRITLCIKTLALPAPALLHTRADASVPLWGGAHAHLGSRSPGLTQARGYTHTARRTCVSNPVGGADCLQGDTGNVSLAHGARLGSAV